MLTNEQPLSHSRGGRKNSVQLAYMDLNSDIVGWIPRTSSVALMDDESGRMGSLYFPKQLDSMELRRNSQPQGRWVQQNATLM